MFEKTVESIALDDPLKITDFPLKKLNKKLSLNFENETINSVGMADLDGDVDEELMIGTINGCKAISISGGKYNPGHLLWELQTKSSVTALTSAHLMGPDDRSVIIGTEEGNIIALNGRDGSERWSFKVDTWPSSSYHKKETITALCVDDFDNDGKQEVVATTQHLLVYLLNSDGSERWHIPSYSRAMISQTRLLHH